METAIIPDSYNWQYQIKEKSSYLKKNDLSIFLCKEMLVIVFIPVNCVYTCACPMTGARQRQPELSRWIPDGAISHLPINNSFLYYDIGLNFKETHIRKND